MTTRDRVAVVTGGAIGTLLRVALDELVAGGGAWPWATFLVNVTGAFVLGWWATRSAGRWHVLLGTGVVGAYTTFSAFAVEAERLLSDGAATMGVAYAVASVVAGLAAAITGARLGRRPSW